MAISSISSLYAVNSSLTSTTSGVMDVKNALKTLGKTPSAQVAVVDSASNIQQYWNTLNAAANKITNISVSDLSQKIKISADQFNNSSTLIDKIQNDKVLSVKGTIDKISPIANASTIDSVDIVDSSTNIQNKLSTLKSIDSKLSSISFSVPANTIKLSADDYKTNYTDLLSKLPATSRFQITGATISDAKSIMNDKRVTSISICDTVDNVASELDYLNSFAGKISSVTNTSASNVLDITEQQYTKDKLILNKIYKGYDLTLHASSIAKANQFKNERIFSHIDIADSSTNFTKSLNLLSSLGTRLSSISLSDPDKGMTLAYRDLMANSTTISKIDNPFAITLKNNNITATQLQNILTTFGLDTQIQFHNVNVTDTAANINSVNDNLYNNLGLKDFQIVDSFRTIDNGPISSKINYTNYNSKFAADTYFKFNDLSVSQFLDASAIYKLKDTSIFTTATELQSNFDKIASLKNSISQINVSPDGTISLPEATVNSNQDLIGKITGLTINSVANNNGMPYSSWSSADIGSYIYDSGIHFDRYYYDNGEYYKDSTIYQKTKLAAGKYKFTLDVSPYSSYYAENRRISFGFTNRNLSTSNTHDFLNTFSESINAGLGITVGLSDSQVKKNIEFVFEITSAQASANYQYLYIRTDADYLHYDNDVIVQNMTLTKL